MVEFKILRVSKTVHSKLLPPGGKRGPRNLVSIQRPSPLTPKAVHLKKKDGRQECQ